MYLNSNKSFEFYANFLVVSLIELQRNLSLDSLVLNSLVPQTGYLWIRAVKVDMQLSFFFILEERQLKQPVAVRLYEIDEASNKNKGIQGWRF